MQNGHERVRQATLKALERQILQLLATGLGTAEISECVGVPIDEVRASLRRILTKLGAQSRLEALIIAIREGLIELPPE